VLNNVVTIHAGTAQAQASAVCGTAPSGRSTVTNLDVNGVAVGSSFNGSVPNQTMTLPNNQGTLTVNEQIVVDSSITVNAIHVHTASGQDFIFGTATAGASTGAGCPTSTPDPVAEANGDGSMRRNPAV
jgi:hypothetical protein